MPAAVASILQTHTFATSTALTAWNMGSDFLIALILFAVLFLFAWYVGRGPFFSLIISFYSAYAIYTFFPDKYLAMLPIPALTPVITTSMHVGLYLALIFVFYMIMRRVIISDFLYVGIFGLLLLSLLGTGFLFALAFQIFDIPSVYAFTPAINMLFAPSQYFFWWFVAPAIGLFLFAR